MKATAAATTTGFEGGMAHLIVGGFFLVVAENLTAVPILVPPSNFSGLMMCV
ncbi:MAG: hypothetical protein VCB81_00400 [Verrucomicrobiia bacterium]